jgi:type II secretory pathway component PulC
MLRSLVIRQVVLGIECALALLLVLLLAMMVREALAAPADYSRGDAAAAPTAAEAFSRNVGPRSSYDGILKSGLFGDAGRFNPDANPVQPGRPEPPKAAAEDTKLPLILRGTTFSMPGDPLATAIIEVREGGSKMDTYYIDQEIVPKVFLREVRQAEVILDNQRTNRLERLQLARTYAPTTASGLPRSRVVTRSLPDTSVRRALPSRRNFVQLDRQDIVGKLNRDYSRLASTVDVQVVRDDSGRVRGLTVDNVGEIPVAAELGILNGDILTSINGEPVDSVEKVRDILQTNQNINIFRIGILRQGRPMFMTYHLK